MIGWKRGGLAHLVIGLAMLIALVAVVQVSLPVTMVAGTVLEVAPELMSIPSVEITVPERPSWEQSVSLRDQCELCRCSGLAGVCSCAMMRHETPLCTGGYRPIFLVGWGNGPCVFHNYS